LNSLLFIAVFAVAVIFSMLGLGGGVLYVPILLQAGLDAHAAVATALGIMLVMSLTAAFVYHRNSLIDWRLLLLMEPFSVIGAVSGSFFSVLIPEKPLYLIFAGAMLISAVMLLFPQKKNMLAAITPKKFPGLIHLSKNGENYSVNMWISVPATFIAGVISSLVGIGGGFMKVPLMTAVFGVPVKIAVATSSAMIVITALSGFSGHAAAGHVDFRLAAVLAVVVFFGAIIGSRVSVKADKKFLNAVLVTLQLSIAVWMVYKAFK
jgi:uncharacterized membrane protein YfcA